MKDATQEKHAEGRVRESFKRGDRHAAAASSPNVLRPLLLSIITVLGFGLFRGVNSNSYLSAFASVEAPFLFVPDLFFNVVVACSVVTTSLIIIALVFKGHLKPLTMPFVPPALLLLVTKLCTLFNVFAVLPSDLALLVPGILFGIASVMLSLVWIEVFACQKPTVIVTQIALGMLVNMVISSVLSTLAAPVQLVVSCALLVPMVLCAGYVRRVLRAGARETALLPDTAVLPDSAVLLPLSKRSRSKSDQSYRDAFLALGDSLVAYCVLEAVIGLLNSFMLAGSITFAGSGSVSLMGTLIGIVVFCVVVFVMQRIPRASTAFRVLMPIIASMLVFLPFLGEVFNLFFSTVLLGSYYFIALIITYVVAEVARAWRVSSYVLLAAAMCVSRVCLAIALVGGHAIGSLPGSLFGESEHVMRYLVIIMAVIYALSVAAVLISRDRRRKRKSKAMPDDMSELAFEHAVNVERGEALDGVGPVVENRAGENAEAPVPDEDLAFAQRCIRLAQRCGLTGREAEILGYLSRGRTNVYIAGTLFVSENTVRSHVRNIYSKLDVHTRQQLIDLVEVEGDQDQRSEA